MSLESLKATLAGDSTEDKLKALLGLPDNLDGATAVLKAALEKNDSDLRVKVAVLDALYRQGWNKQEVKQQLIEILESPETEGDQGEEIYMMARTLLNRIDNDDEDALRGEGIAVEVLGVAPGEEAERFAVVIHGTWARDGEWWRPGGDFHTYLKTEVGLDYLYDGTEPFVWSGRNRNAARHNAAEAFGEWVIKFKPKSLEVFAHSHGANVAMLSTKMGLEIDRLVMMSPPVRKDYFANWQKVKQAYNIQASFDAVVGIAHGEQWFPANLNKIKQKEIPYWSHSASHDPQAWKDQQLPAFVGLT